MTHESARPPVTILDARARVKHDSRWVERLHRRSANGLRFCWTGGLIAVAAVEIGLAPHDLPPRLLVLLLGTFAIALAVVALALDLSREREPLPRPSRTSDRRAQDGRTQDGRTQDGRERRLPVRKHGASPRSQGRGSSPLGVETIPDRAPKVRPRGPEEKPRPSRPPRFGRGSKAQALPWLLPHRPVQPGVAADEARIGDLRVRAASVVGPGHRCEEPAQPRQDSYRLGRDTAGEHLVLAVADGVSSSRYADLGATVATSTAVHALRDQLHDSPNLAELSATEVFTTVSAEMSQAAAGRGIDDSDIAAVAVLAVIPANSTDGERDMWLGWVGDVSVWSLNNGVWSWAAGDPKGRTDGEYDSNAVAHVLPDQPNSATGSMVRLRSGDALAFVTDGLGDALASLDDLNKYLGESWKFPPPCVSFLNDLSFDAQRFLDDRTAVTVWIDPDLRSSDAGEDR